MPTYLSLNERCVISLLAHMVRTPWTIERSPRLLVQALMPQEAMVIVEAARTKSLGALPFRPGVMRLLARVYQAAIILHDSPWRDPEREMRHWLRLLAEESRIMATLLERTAMCIRNGGDEKRALRDLAECQRFMLSSSEPARLPSSAASSAARSSGGTTPASSAPCPSTAPAAPGSSSGKK